jgi:hypothetical protein
MNTAIFGSPARVPAATLDTWTAHDWSTGVLLPHLAPHDRLIVRTRNSTYEIIVMVPHTASVMVRGGAFFPNFTAARVAGTEHLQLAASATAQDSAALTRSLRRASDVLQRLRAEGGAQ